VRRESAPHGRAAGSRRHHDDAELRRLRRACGRTRATAATTGRRTPLGERTTLLARPSGWSGRSPRHALPGRAFDRIAACCGSAATWRPTATASGARRRLARCKESTAGRGVPAQRVWENEVRSWGGGVVAGVRGPRTAPWTAAAHAGGGRRCRRRCGCGGPSRREPAQAGPHPPAGHRFRLAGVTAGPASRWRRCSRGRDQRQEVSRRLRALVPAVIDLLDQLRDVVGKTSRRRDGAEAVKALRRGVVAWGPLNGGFATVGWWQRAGRHAFSRAARGGPGCGLIAASGRISVLSRARRRQ